MFNKRTKNETKNCINLEILVFSLTQSYAKISNEI